MPDRVPTAPVRASPFARKARHGDLGRLFLRASVNSLRVPLPCDLLYHRFLAAWRALNKGIGNKIMMFELGACTSGVPGLRYGYYKMLLRVSGDGSKNER